MTTDMSKTTAPKSDQMNYDDFIGGPKNITITRVDISNNTEEDQPAKVFYQGDNGKPYKPCKSMRRVMVAVWGKDSTQYVGRSMTLFGDPNVVWAGQPVGGIRISHMSHMDKPMNVVISLSKGKRVPCSIKPLVIDLPDTDEENDDPYDVLYTCAKDASEEGIEKYRAFFTGLNAADKKRLNDAGDHAKLKDLAEKVNQTPDYGME